jgi:hypothetical protein
MKAYLFYIPYFIFFSCVSQEQILKKIDLSSQQELNYIFSRIVEKKSTVKLLYKEGLFVSIIEISDSKATPENLFEGYYVSVSSFYISVFPDGDGYKSSKLHKIEGLIHPKIIDISETKYPNFKVKIEHTSYDERVSEIFELEGDF